MSYIISTIPFLLIISILKAIPLNTHLIPKVNESLETLFTNVIPGSSYFKSSPPIKIEEIPYLKLIFISYVDQIMVLSQENPSSARNLIPNFNFTEIHFSMIRGTDMMVNLGYNENSGSSSIFVFNWRERKLSGEGPFLITQRFLGIVHTYGNISMLYNEFNLYVINLITGEYFQRGNFSRDIINCVFSEKINKLICHTSKVLLFCDVLPDRDDDCINKNTLKSIKYILKSPDNEHLMVHFIDHTTYILSLTATLGNINSNFVKVNSTQLESLRRRNFVVQLLSNSSYFLINENEFFLTDKDFNRITNSTFIYPLKEVLLPARENWLNSSYFFFQKNLDEGFVLKLNDKIDVLPDGTIVTPMNMTFSTDYIFKSFGDKDVLVSRPMNISDKRSVIMFDLRKRSFIRKIDTMDDIDIFAVTKDFLIFYFAKTFKFYDLKTSSLSNYDFPVESDYCHKIKTVFFQNHDYEIALIFFANKVQFLNVTSRNIVRNLDIQYKDGVKIENIECDSFEGGEIQFIAILLNKMNLYMISLLNTGPVNFKNMDFNSPVEISFLSKGYGLKIDENIIVFKLDDTNSNLINSTYNFPDLKFISKIKIYQEQQLVLGYSSGIIQYRYGVNKNCDDGLFNRGEYCLPNCVKNENTYLDIDSGKCLNACPNFEFRFNSKICKMNSAIRFCLQISTSDQQCSICEPGYYIENGNCSKCEDKFPSCQECTKEICLMCKDKSLITTFEMNFCNESQSSDQNYIYIILTSILVFAISLGGLFTIIVYRKLNKQNNRYKNTAKPDARMTQKTVHSSGDIENDPSFDFNVYGDCNIQSIETFSDFEQIYKQLEKSFPVKENQELLKKALRKSTFYSNGISNSKYFVRDTVILSRYEFKGVYYAVKSIISDNPNILAEFLEETHNLKVLSVSEYIVRPYFIFKNILAIEKNKTTLEVGHFMEYVPQNLYELIRNPKKIKNFNFNTKVRIIKDIMLGLKQFNVRGKNIVHGNLKPANILIKIDENQKTFRNALFSNTGQASILNNDNDLIDAKYFTLNYSSPEQFKLNKVCSKTDIYAVGLIGIELFFGKRLKKIKELSSREDFEKFFEKNFKNITNELNENTVLELFKNMTLLNWQDRPTVDDVLSEIRSFD